MSGSALGDGLHCSVRFFGFAANLHVLLLIDQKGESLTQKRMIVDDEDIFLACFGAALSGVVSVTHSIVLSTGRHNRKGAVHTVPRTGCGPTSSLSANHAGAITHDVQPHALSIAAYLPQMPEPSSEMSRVPQPFSDASRMRMLRASPCLMALFTASWAMW